MEEWIWMNRGYILSLFTLALVSISFIRGGGPEKATAATFAAMFGVDRIYHFFATGGASIWTLSTYQKVDIGHAVIDSIALLALMNIAVRANRIYPLCIGALQIIATFSHFSMILITDAHPVAYSTIERVPYYIQILAFMAGLGAYQVRVQRKIIFRDWRMQSEKIAQKQ